MIILPGLNQTVWGPVNNTALQDLDDRVADLEVAGRPTWLSGHGVPLTGTGVTGDFYLDLDTSKLYKKTDAVTWTYQVTISGPQGLPGVGSAAFQASHAYTVGTIVQHTDGTWLRVITNHTSGSSIDLTKFEPVSTSTSTVDGAALSAAYVAAVNPEFYGAGYGGAASDDWGPAFNAAIVAATAAGTNVQCLSKSYGIRTTIVWPSGSRVHIEGRSETSKIVKLADVTLVNCSGTASQREYGRTLRYMFLDGGNNPAWTAPLYRNDYTSRADTVFCWFWQNYGKAMTSKQAWDSRHDHPSILYCGGTDGLTPAVDLNGSIADGGNATNNVWFINPRIEGFRSGAIWAVGGDASSALFGIKIIGTAKLELSASSPYYGPSLRLGYVTNFVSDAIQFTLNGGTVAGTQSRPFEAFVHAYGLKAAQFGRIYGNIGSVAAGDVDALFHFDGATAANTEISWVDISLNSGSGTTSNRPAFVFKWSGTNNLVQRGAVRWNSNYWNVPTDSGDPTTLSNLPTVAGASDSTYATAAQRTAVNGDMVYDTNVSQVMLRIGGIWVTAGANITRYPGTNPDWLMNASIGTAQPYRRNNIPRWACASSRTPTAGTLEMVAVVLQAGDVVSDLFASINTAFTFGTTGIGFWLALYGPQSGSTVPLLAWTGDQSSSGATIATGAYEKPITKDAAGATISSYTVPTTGIYWIGLMANVGTGGSPSNGKWNAAAVSSFTLVQGSITGEQSYGRIADTGQTTAPPSSATMAGFPSQLIYAGSR